MSHFPAITITGTTVTIDGFTAEDAVLAEMLEGHPVERRAEVLGRILSVGARGLASMAAGITMNEVEERVRLVLESVTAEAEQRVDQLLSAGREAFAASFDPEVRSSMIGRSLHEFGAWRDGLLGSIDPDRADSHAARMFARLADLLGPGGVLDTQLRAALDLDGDESALGAVHRSMEERFRELRELVIAERAERHGREVEAARGTAKGGEFEDVVDECLRTAARAMGGCLVERTGDVPGVLGGAAYVGDFVVTLPDGGRIVVEAKNQARIDLTGRTGILAELDRAMENRTAGYAICVSARDAFPREAGPFAVYGRRILVVDDGDGALTAAALRWAQAGLAADGTAAADGLDAVFVMERLERIRELGRRFASSRRTLTAARASLDTVAETLGEMRTGLAEIVDEIAREVARARAADGTTESLRVA